MEIVTPRTNPAPVRAVLLDFDGTLSTIRCGWEDVMRPLMLEMLSPGGQDASVAEAVDRYIDQSTGIQTIHQMKWLAARAHRANPAAPDDPWWYKDEYNRRLMRVVEERVQALLSKRAPRDSYLIAGSEDFLRALKDRGVALYVASGTDDPDVRREVAALGLTDYFTRVSGAPVREESCSKEQVIDALIRGAGLSGADFAVVGDGKVEIALGRAAGARTLGLATDEHARSGINPVKRARLLQAGADAIAGDFLDLRAILGFLGLEV
ncbi:MAG: HAD family hydrolase [Christensenellales bacterium]|jgi:phosphoglycolate phosphatase-like HAD superfamily hydrolase